MTPRRAKKRPGIVAEATLSRTKSAMESNAATPAHWWAAHWVVEPIDYAGALSVGHRFVTLAGSELRSEGQVQGALKRDGEVWSNE